MFLGNKLWVCASLRMHLVWPANLLGHHIVQASKIEIFKIMHLAPLFSEATQQPASLYRCLLTHWPLGDLDAILKMEFSILFYWLVSSDNLMIMPSDECHRTLLMISQHWFRWWLGAVRQQTITWANVDSVSCRLMVSLGHNELIQKILQSNFILCELISIQHTEANKKGPPICKVFKSSFLKKKLSILIKISVKFLL